MLSFRHMSPEPDFWTDVKTDTATIGQVDSWGQSRISHDQFFACQLQSPNGHKVLAVLRTDYHGTGTLVIPLANDSDTNNDLVRFKKHAAQNNKDVLSIKGMASATSAFETMGLQFRTTYPSTYATVETSTSGSGEDFNLTISTDRTNRAMWVSTNNGITFPQTALAIAKDIEAALPGYILTPIKI